MSKLLSWNVLSHKYNDRKVLLPNVEAVGQTQAELHIIKVEKLHEHVKPLCESGHM